MDVLAGVLRRAAADPATRGVILTGSHARGMATEYSDIDVTVVVAGEGVGRRHVVRTADLDEVVCTVGALADTSVRWQRYAYRGATVLLDRLDGRIAELVARQATLTGAEAAERELDTCPLPGAWNDALDPERLPDAALRLFPAVERLAREGGHGDLLDSWGDDIALIRAAAH